MGTLTACLLQHPLGKVQAQRLRTLTKTYGQDANAAVKAAEDMLAELHAERDDIHAQIAAKGGVVPQPAEATAPDTPDEAAPKAVNVPATKAVKHPQKLRGSFVLAAISQRLGGLSPKLLPDLSERVERTTVSKLGKQTRYIVWDNPPVPGIGPLFRLGGTEDMSEVARVLEEEGFIAHGSLEQDGVAATQQAEAIVRAEMKDGGKALRVGDTESMEAEYRRRAEAANIEAPEADTDAMTDDEFFASQRTSTTTADWTLTADDLVDSGYERVSPQMQAATDALMSEAEALGIDTSELRLDVSDQERAVTQSPDAYEARLQAAARTAIARALAANRQAAAGTDASGTRAGHQDRGKAAGAESSAGTRKPADGQAGRPDAATGQKDGLTLESQDATSLREKTEREAAATAAEQAKKAAEQTRLRKEAETRDNKARADSTVDDFQLGQSADQQMSGIDDLFSQKDEPAPDLTPSATPAEDLDAMFDSLLAEKTADVPGGRIAAQKAAKERSTPRARKPKADKAPATPDERSAAAAAASAARNGAAALNDAIDGLGKLFGGSGRLNSGISFDEESYAKAKPLFIKALAQLKTAGSDLREAMSKLIDMLLAKYGPQAAQNMKPYVVRFITDVRAGKVVLDADNAATLKGTRDASTADTAVERDRQGGAADPAAVERDVQTGRRPADEGNRGAGGPAGEAGGRPAYSAGVPADGAVAGRERGDQQLHRGDGERPPAGGAAGAGVGQRSVDAGGERISPDPVADSAVEDAVDVAGDHLERLAAQRAANSLAVKPGDLDNVRATLPYLLPEQQEDVHKAEQRFAQDDGYGMLFTNSAGTGKTFTGLGVIKRRAMQGDTNTLVVVPDAKIMADWVKSGKALGLTITPLADTKDAGKGVTITTYANLGDNDALATRQWGLIVPDEAHKLMQSEGGDQTKALDALRALALHPRGVRTRFDMLNRADLARQEELSQRMRANDKLRNLDDTTEMQRAKLAAETETLAAEYKVLADKLAAERAKVQAHHEAHQGALRTRVMGLSATPFAYEKTVDWADGLLFDYGQDYTPSRGYNAPSPQQSFFMRHFGWFMKNGKLNEPGKLVDRGLMQRQFHAWLVKKGVLSGRDLMVKPDYDRRFILAESAVGTEIDRALGWLQTRRGEVNAALTAANDKQTTNGFSLLQDELDGTFYGPQGHLVRRYLLEAIKAKEVVRHVREHMALGRKVVVFHDFNKGGSTNPFDFTQRAFGTRTDLRPEDRAKQEDENARKAAYNEAAAEFAREFPKLADSSMLSDLVSPIERFTAEFPDVLLVNGLQKKSDLLARYAKFQDDASGPQVMLVQSDKNAGWSGHDTTGKHQRVLFNLGLPTQPTKTTQQEGRIYRTGQATNAMFRYLNTGTNWERWAFATTIAERASAAENLAKGEGARALKDAFIDGFEESGDYPAGHEGEGTGGKARDRARANVLTLFDRAKTFYFGQQKKTARTKAAEGTDYFATPEPVGLKMVEWADLRGGEDALEPSAGHGAIARWFGDNVLRTAIKPSAELASRLALVFDGKVIQGTFEGLNVVNKYDAIVMNPPFGTAGRTAIDHLAKAATHLRDGGRIVALIPAGPSADAKFEGWMYEDSTRPAKPLYVSPIHGPIYEGDTLVMSNFGGQPLKLTVGHIDGSGSGPRYARPKGERVASGVNLSALSEVRPTGQRTEKFSASAGLHLVADIALPASTFERAGTKVMTRIVVIEKPLPGQSAPQQVNRDLSDAADINALFERLQNLTIQPRAKPVATEGQSVAAAPANTAATEADAGEQAAMQAGLAPFDYTTAKGRVLRVVEAPHLTRAQAEDIEGTAWKPKAAAGYYVKTKNVPAMLAKYPVPAGGQRLNTLLLRLLDNFAALGERKGTARQGMQDAESKLNIRLGLTPTREDSLGFETPAAVDLATGEVLYNPSYKTLTRAEWAQSMAEEILHAVDLVAPNRAMSTTSTRLAIGSGDIALEAQAVFDSGRGLADYLSYPFKAKFGLTGLHQQAELFARLGVLYHGDQALMQRSLPIAYEAFHVLFAATPTGFDSRLLTDVRRADPRGRGLGGSSRGQDSGFDGSRGQSDGRQATDQGLDALRANIARIFDADPAGGEVGGRRVETRSGTASGGPTFQNIARTAPDGEEANALAALAANDELFALPKSEGTTVRQIAADIDPEIKVTPRNIPGEQRFDLTMPDGTNVRLIVRKPNPYGPTLYGFNQSDGEMTQTVEERPGKNAEAVAPGTEDVYIDASLLSSGKFGAAAYQIAATFAHNTGRIFIGDPAGLSNEALVRRPEQMLSSALKFGTTAHLAPHPRQVQGDARLDVPPLRWVYGDDLGNIRRLVDLNLHVQDNLSDAITFDPASGEFRDSEGYALSRADIGLLAEATGLGGVRRAGGNTIARSVVLRALLREAGGESAAGGRRDGLLARLARLAGNAGEATQGLFYDQYRGDRDSTGEREPRLTRLAAQLAAQGYERATVPQVRAAAEMRKLVEDHAAGKISDGTLAMRLGVLADRMSAAADTKAANRLLRGDRVRGVDFVREKLLAARRRGELSPEGVALALWALDKNPALAENLGISVTAAPEGQRGVSGDYNPATEVIRLFTSANANPDTVAHEILHHAERMMPPDMQAAIRREWARALAAAIKAGTPEQVAALKLIPEAMAGDSKAHAALVKAIQNGPLTYDAHYPLVNPSEFWAVNGARILAERFDAKGSVWARIGKWLREMVDKARGLVGLPSNTPVIKALNRVLDAKQNAAPREGRYGRETTMLADPKALAADGAVQSASAMKSGFEKKPDGEARSATRPSATQERPIRSRPNLGAGDASIGGDEQSTLQDIQRSPAEREFIRKSGTGGPPSAGEKIRSYFGRALDAWHSNWARQFQQGFADQFTGIAEADKSVLGVTHLLPEQSNYVAARLANGGTSSVMRALLLHGQARWAANGQHLEKIDGTKGLLDIFAPLGNDVNDFFRWMIANRADRLFREGRENNFTREEIDAGLALGNEAGGRPRADFRAAALQYAAFKRSVLDIAEKAGLINAESRKVWDQADYIPFYREVDREGTFSAVGKKGLAGQTSGIRTLKGGTAVLNDPMENIIMNFSRLIDASLKNNAIVKTVKSYEVANSGIVEKLNHAFSGQIVPASQVKKLLEEAGTPAAVMAVIPAEAFDGMAKMWALAPPAGPDVVRIMVDGKAQFYKVHDALLLKALTSFVPFDFPGLGVARAFKRVLTGAITATPEFMVRNFIRDSISVQLVGRDGFNPGASLANVLHAYNEEGGSEAMLFAGASFQGGQYNANDPKGAAAQMRRALRRKGLSAAGADARVARLMDTPSKAWDKWRHFGEATENANRLAVYEATLRAGKGATAAAFESKDIMDFSLRGSSPIYQVMADVLPFFNARVQGLYRVGRADPKRLVKYGMVMAVLSTMLALANSGNDDYDELKDWDKDAYWHFWIRGEHFTIPKAFEVGAVFGTIPERIVRYIKGQDSGNKTFKRVVGAVVDQFAFDPVPQLVRPGLNAYMNKDTFRDRPIEGQRDEGKLPSERYNGMTSPTAVKAVQAIAPTADAIGLSPKKLEYLVQGYLGTVGMYALGISDAAVNYMTDAAPKPAGKTADLPIVKSFYRQEPARGTVFEDDLYKLRTEVDQIFRSVQAQRNAGNDDAADALEKRHEKALDVRGMVDGAAQTLAGLNKERDAIYADREMTPAGKRKAIDALTREKAELARETMKDPDVLATQ